MDIKFKLSVYTYLEDNIKVRNACGYVYCDNDL